jgi:Reverse transcriptase (RNA-dependent DNA polymerase)
VVDVDLERFFDRVNHDVLMGKLAARIGDRRVLGLIRRYLEAGIMVHGVVIERHEGTPQGGPLSPMTATCTCARAVPVSGSCGDSKGGTGSFGFASMGPRAR